MQFLTQQSMVNFPNSGQLLNQQFHAEPSKKVNLPRVVKRNPIEIDSLLQILHLIRTHLSQFDFHSTKSSQTTKLARDLDQLTANDSAIVELSSPAHAGTEELLLLLSNLVKIPQACSIEEEGIEPSSILERERFLNALPSLLELLNSLLKLHPVISCDATVISLFFSYARFYPLDIYDSTPTAISILGSCQLILEPNRFHSLHQILSVTFPPYFKPHPKINPQSGRKLDRPLGGDRGLTDYYEVGLDEVITWRRDAGLGNIVNAVINLIHTDEIEELWRFILSPLLAYLDDYEQNNKLIGLKLLDSLLSKVESSLLIRTGVGLVFTVSITTTFTSHTPILLTHTHATALRLIDSLYPPVSSALVLTISKKQSLNRFESLCKLLDVGIVRVWEFKGGNIEIELALQKSLQPLIQKLEISIVRYLAVLFPHLCALISLTPPSVTSLELYLTTVSNLRLLVEIVKVRIGNFRGILISSVAKCWVNLKEEESGLQLKEKNLIGWNELKSNLIELLLELGNVDQVSREINLPRLKEFRDIFVELVQ